MVTQCPVCRQWFHIGSEEAETAYGLARCGGCGTVFNALATLRERLPSVRGRESPAYPPEDALPPHDALVETAEDSETVGGNGDAYTALAPLLETRAQPRRPAHWLWAAAAVLAALALAAQLVHANRYAIARIAVAGPALAAVYRAFGSSLGDRLALGSYVIADASLETAPDSVHALVLDGSLINRGSFPQRLPLIRLRLSNRRGGTIGSRVLLPSDYEATTISTLASGQTLHFRVTLSDPGVSAVGFTLVLCKRRNDRIVCRGS